MTCSAYRHVAALGMVELMIFLSEIFVDTGSPTILHMPWPWAPGGKRFGFVYHEENLCGTFQKSGDPNHDLQIL